MFGRVKHSSMDKDPQKELVKIDPQAQQEIERKSFYGMMVGSIAGGLTSVVSAGKNVVDVLGAGLSTGLNFIVPKDLFFDELFCILVTSKSYVIGVNCSARRLD